MDGGCAGGGASVSEAGGQKNRTLSFHSLDRAKSSINSGVTVRRSGIDCAPSGQIVTVRSGREQIDTQGANREAQLRHARPIVN